MANSFSLLSFPNKVRLRVLRLMDGKTLFLFSLVSRKTKEMARCLQLQPSDIVISIRNDIFLTIDTPINAELKFYKEPEQDMGVLKKPVNIWISDGSNDERKLSNLLELEEWLKHIFYIFNCERAPEIIFDGGSEIFNLQAIKNTFGKIRSLVIFSGATHQSIDIMTCFLPNVTELNLVVDPFPPGDNGLHKVLLQNFEFLNLGGEDQFENFSLNDLLVSNAAYVEHEVPFDSVLLNRFLKLWMKGACPALIQLSMIEPTVISDSIFNGVNVLRRIPADEDIILNDMFYHRGYCPERIAAEIGRFDGTKATVYIVESNFSFRVWDFIN